MLRSFVAVVAVALLAAQAQAQLTLHTVAGDPMVAAMSRQGMLVLADRAGVVTGYPRVQMGVTDKPVTARIGLNPTAICHKQLGDRGYFVVACEGDKSLHVLHDQTLEPLGVISLAGVPRSVAAAHSPKQQHVYYALAVTSLNAQFRVGRIDLATLKDEGLIEGPSGISSITVSADGTTLYGTRTGYSPSGRYVYQLPEQGSGALVARQLMQEHASVATFHPDPSGLYFSSDHLLYSPDWRNERRSLPGVVTAFFDERPLLVCVQNNKAIIVSTNSFLALAEVALDKLDFRSRRGSGQWVFTDSSSGAIIFWNGSTVAVTSLAKLKVPVEPFLAADIAADAPLAVGRPAIIKVTTKDRRGTVRLVSGPPGMKLEGDQLRWTPTDAQVGALKAVIQISVPPHTNQQEILLEVSRPRVRLAAPVQRLVVSDDGAMAVVLLGPQALSDPNQPRRLPDPRATNRTQQPEPATLALVDLRKLEIVAQRTLPYSVLHLAMGQHVYVASPDSAAFHALSIKDLSDVKRVFTSAPVTEMVPVADRLFVRVAARSPDVYVVPSLVSADGPATDTDEPVNAQISRIPLKIGDGWLHQGVYYDHELKNRLGVLQSSDFVELPGPSPDARRSTVERRAVLRLPWGVLVQPGAITRANGQLVGRIGGSEVALLPDLPAAVALFPPDDRESRTAGRARCLLQLVDLVTARPAESLVLCEEPATWRVESQHMHLRAAPGVIVAAVRESLFVIPTASLNLGALSVPVHFQAPTEMVVLRPGGTQKVRFTAVGGDQLLEYALAMDMTGFDIDKRTGVVTVDVDLLVKQAPPLLVERIWRLAQSAARATTRPAESLAFDDIIQGYATAFQGLTGMKPQGIPAVVPITVTVRDSENQSAALTQFFFVDVPAATVSALLREREQQARQQQEEWARAREQRAAQFAGGNAAAQQRIAELERENAELRAQVELLKELFGARGPATRPSVR